MSKRYLLDALERVAWTAVQAAAGAFLDVASSGEVSWRAAGYAAALAVAKVVLARLIGSRESASTLPDG